MKYYAEVPIHSPTGLTIGTLCVVDNKPREGLDMKGLEILREISEAVMNHLELCVSKIQRNNAERMIHALGGFVQGSDSVRNRWLEAQATRFPEPGQRHLSIAERAKLEFDGYPVATIAKEDMKSPGSATLSPDIISSAQSDGKSTNPREATTRRTTSDTLTSEKVESETSNTTIEVPGHNAENEGTEQSDSLTQLEGLLARATNLIREGIGLDGVVFLDPRSTDGMLLTDINPAVERSKWYVAKLEQNQLPCADILLGDQVEVLLMSILMSMSRRLKNPVTQSLNANDVAKYWDPLFNEKTSYHKSKSKPSNTSFKISVTAGFCTTTTRA